MLIFRSVLLGALALVTLPVFGAAQGRTPKLRFVDPDGLPLPIDFLIVRDARGVEVTPEPERPGQWAFSNVGRKVSFQFTRKGLKVPGFDLILEDAPTVYVSLVLDPRTGKIKSLSQKPQGPTPLSSGKIRRGRLGAAIAPPANDDCTNALPILDGVTAFTTIEATTDGAPDPNGQYDGQTYQDIWYLYTPTCNGSMSVSTCATADYDTDLVLYDADADGDGDHDGNDCLLITGGGAPALASNDDAGNCAGFTSIVSAPVSANRRYLVRVGGFGPGDEGSGSLLVSCSGAPSNDICQAAIDLTCGASVDATNVGATTGPMDPEFSCAFGGPRQGEATLWYSFTATGASAFLSTGNSAGVSDTLLAVYRGDCDGLVELACDDDGAVGLLSELCVDDLTIGEVYYVQVATYPGSGAGRITLDLECPGPCEVSCDEVAAACAVPCGSSLTVDNTNANTDPLDPEFSCRFGGAGQGVGTLWFQFVASATSAFIHTNDSLALDTLLAVYEGPAGALTEIACSDDDGVGLLSEVCLSGLTVGQTYTIQVASFSSFDTGPVTVSVECACAPGLANDECAGALPLGPLPASVTVDIASAGDDMPMACGAIRPPSFNVWYRVVGTGNSMTATTCNAETQVTDTKIAVFCAGCAAPLCVAGNDDNCPSGGSSFASTASWCTQPGAEYLITVGTFSTSTTPGVVRLDVFDSGMACAADVQCLPEGACCLADGTCATTTAVDCLESDGVYQGDGTSCTTEFVADGGFEAGGFGGVWTEFSTNFGTPICDVGTCGLGGGTGPNTGLFWAWFGGTFSFEQGFTEQNLILPAGAGTLDFYLAIPVSSGNGMDSLSVAIDGMTLFQVLESDATYAGAIYQLVSIPLGSLADGGLHTLRFDATTLGRGPAGQALTNFFVDDVSLALRTFTCQQCFTLDFETEDDFATPLGNGQTISTPPEFGNLVSITSTGFHAGAAIFDSTPGGPNDPSQDRDLLVGRGNLLILQNSQVPGKDNGFFDEPNDDQDGGNLIFDADSPITPMSVVLVDIDVGAEQSSGVFLTDTEGRTRTYTVPAQWTEDILINGGSGWRTLDLTTLDPQPGFASVATASEDEGYDGTQVVRIRVHLGSSGAMDDLTFCQ